MVALCQEVNLGYSLASCWKTKKHFLTVSPPHKWQSMVPSQTHSTYTCIPHSKLPQCNSLCLSVFRSFHLDWDTAPQSCSFHPALNICSQDCKRTIHSSGSECRDMFQHHMADLYLVLESQRNHLHFLTISKLFLSDFPRRMGQSSQTRHP